MEANRESTRRGYYGIWKNFNEFFIQLDQKPKTWEERLTLYVAFLIEKNKKSATIKSYISAIKAVLRDDGIEINENKYLLTSLTKACRLKNDHVRTRLPIQQQMLNILLNQVTQYYDEILGQSYLSKLYRALFASAYYGELTSGTHPVYATNVHIGQNKKKIMFILHTSKTHWSDVKPQKVKISNHKKGNLNKCASLGRDNGVGGLNCPYNILKDFADSRPTCKSLNKPFFVFSDRSPVKPTHMREALKTSLKLAGFQQKMYDTHSFRIGSASQLLKNNFSIDVIKKLGRWRSNCVYNYLR